MIKSTLFNIVKLKRNKNKIKKTILKSQIFTV